MSSATATDSLHPPKPELFPYTRRYFWPVAKWCLRIPWRLLRFWFTKKGVFTAAILATLVFAAVVIENIRGRKAWEACKAKMESQGFNFNWLSYDPPNIPAEQNAARHPFFAQFCDGEPVLRDSPLPTREKRGAVADSAQRNPKIDLARFCQEYRKRLQAAWDMKKEYSDLAEWKRQVMALAGKTPAGPAPSSAEILDATQEYDATVVQMADAFQRPHFVWFDTAYTRFWTDIPAMSRVFDTVQFITWMAQLRYPAYLETGDHARARREIECLIRFCSAKVGSVSIVQILIEDAVAGVLAEALPDILRNPEWNKEDLAAFSRLLEPFNLPAAQNLAFRKETAAACAAMTSIDSHPEWITSWQPPWLRLVPTGWFYQNAVTYCEWKNQSILAAYDPVTQRFNPQAKDPVSVMPKRPGPYTVMAMIAMPAMCGVFSDCAKAQTIIDECRLLCALRRHFLTTGSWPDSLKSLVPRFLAELPHDWVTGEPPRFAKSTFGCKVWTTGWDGNDDGGIPDKDWVVDIR